MKQKLKKWLYMAGLLCMSVSCKKEVEFTSSDCGAPEQKMTYRTTIKNARADLGQDGYLVIEGVEGAPLICYQQDMQLLSNLKVTYRLGQPQPYKYRVWGRIYNCDNCPTLIKGDALEIKVTKIEYQN